MKESVWLKCVANGANITNGFTDGEFYHATHYKNSLYVCMNDNGDIRFVIPNEPSPHLKLVRKAESWPQTIELCVGRFEVIAQPAF